MTAWVPSWRGGVGAAEATADGIAAWVRSDALGRLVRLWGEQRPVAADTDSLLEWLDAFSAEHWDFRKGRERNLAASAALSPAQAAAVFEAAPELGLVASWPTARTYDAIVMTGGMVRAGLVKPRFVRSLLDAGVAARRIVFLGAHRAFQGDEAALATALGVPGHDEVDAMAEGMRRAFDLGAPALTHGGAGNARTTRLAWDAHPGVRFEVVAAPSSDPDARRADTADTFRHWARSSGADTRSVLVVTTPVYVPYQAAVAVETLGIEAGMAVETVGADAQSNDLGEYTQHFGAQQHLQEIRSAIRGMKALWAHSILRSAGM
ncbi:hypothetical protein FVA74_07490 [Salinibacterium sp. dk2585]|uniref:hypothetical protein n=1 Tax=unclassified Salinibacterium TaxID=2632331 RepID=UPI0011C24A72|nr:MULTISPECIES: hypothetical protein [unclassified Salinibacterium]QEE61437.1 hypothetical protein FVA74_07490 [Salinibacterium sp. dk2585]TXK54114.1 hypothetical protein FVP63_08940 [Salinibacterium sp. dk5596]